MSVQPYTPTTEEVRLDYVMAYTDRESSQVLAEQSFDSWYQAEIAAAEQRGAIKALRSAADHLGNQGPITMSHREVYDHLNMRADRMEDDDD